MAQQMAQRMNSVEDLEQQQQLRGPREHIQLNRLNSRQESAERQRIRAIFDRYDENGDERLSIREMQKWIRDKKCPELTKHVSKKILDYADVNGDGLLDFEEFYTMSREHQWLFRDYAQKYCRLIVPNRNPVNDEIGTQVISRSISYDQNDGDGQYENSMTFCPPPLTMIVFSIIEIITFIIDIIHFRDYSSDINTVGTSTNGPAATLFIYNPRLREEAWRFVTYMFVHVGVMHILMNLLVQIFLGVALELVHCWWRVALVYVAGVAAGSMGTSISNPRIYLAGASGGVYALITAHIATIIMNWGEMSYAIVQLMVFLVYIGTDVGSSIYRHLTDVHDRVGYMAHLCGGLAGLLVGIGVLRNLKVRPWEKKLWWAAVTIYFASMIAGICFHIFNPEYFDLNLQKNFI